MKQQDLTLNIHIISRLTHIYYTGELRKLRVTMGQFPFIMALKDNQGVSQEKLSASLRISKSTTTVIIGQLLSKGLVQRVVDTSDRRNFRISLTEKGFELIPKIEAVIDNCHTLIMKGLSNAEKIGLNRYLLRVRKTAERKLCKS